MLTIGQARNIFFSISFVSALLAFVLSFQVEYHTLVPRVRPGQEAIAAANSISTGLAGGAAGFAILSGLALIAVAITYLKDDNEKNKQ